jgi:hypothetical protein
LERYIRDRPQEFGNDPHLDVSHLLTPIFALPV